MLETLTAFKKKQKQIHPNTVFSVVKVRFHNISYRISPHIHCVLQKKYLTPPSVELLAWLLLRAPVDSHLHLDSAGRCSGHRTSEACYPLVIEHSIAIENGPWKHLMYL